MTGTAVTWVNGEVSSASEARVSASDRGLLYGDGVFETLRAYDGVVFRLQAHLDRLQSGAETLKIPLPYSPAQLSGAVADALAAGSTREAYVRITLSRGTGGLPSDLVADQAPTVLIHARPFGGYASDLYERGMRGQLSTVRRNDTSPLANIKSLNYLDNLLARARALAEGFDEAIMLNTRQQVAEGTASNLFIVRGDRVLTAPVSDGVLPGITRAAVMGLTQAREQSFGLDELREADEVFLTNSLMEVMPLVALDGTPIGSGIPGSSALDTLRMYRELVERETSHPEV